METSTFGKKSKDHSFASEACFEHTLIFVLKGGFLADTEQKNLLECHTLFKHLHKMICWSKTLISSSIKNPIDNYSQQKNIDPERVKQFLASALHFDLDMATVIRFLGGNYTGEYRDTKRTIKALKDTNCDKQIIKDIERTLLVGCPNKMNSSSTHGNLMKCPCNVQANFRYLLVLSYGVILVFLFWTCVQSPFNVFYAYGSK